MGIIVAIACSRAMSAFSIDQRLDHCLVGVAEFALVVDDAPAFEAWRFLGEVAVGIDGERNVRIDAALAQGRFVGGPDFEVVSAVTRRCVHETRSCVLGDVLASEERDVKIVAVDHAADVRPLRTAAFQRSHLPSRRHDSTRAATRSDSAKRIGEHKLGHPFSPNSLRAPHEPRRAHSRCWASS